MGEKNVPEEKTKEQLLEQIARGISSKNEAIRRKESGGKYKPNKSSRKRAFNAVKESAGFKKMETMSVQELENLSKMSGEDLHAYWQGLKADVKEAQEKMGVDKATQKQVEEFKAEDKAAREQIEQEKKVSNPTVKQETVKKEEPQQPARTYAIPLTPEHVMQATADIEPLMGKMPKLKNVDENAVRGHLYNVAVAAAVGKDAIASLDMNEPGAKEDLSKSLADVMVMQVIQTGIESNDPDFKKALDTPGGLQRMERILKENPIFRDMVGKPDTPEAATALVKNSTRAEKYRFAYNAARLSMKPEKVQTVSEPAENKTQESLQNEEAEKAKIDGLFGEGAYEESKKVQAEKEKFEKVFGEGTFIPYQESKGKRTVDVKPFISALGDLPNIGMDFGEGLQKELNSFMNAFQKVADKEGKLPVMRDQLQQGFRRLTREAHKLQKNLSTGELGNKGWKMLEVSDSVHVLSSMVDLGVAPNSMEGAKRMLAAKIAFGGSLGFTDGQSFAADSKKFMKTVDLVMKSRTFQSFTQGKSTKEIGKMTTLDTNELFQDFNGKLMAGKEKKLETGQKNREKTVDQKKPQINEKKVNSLEKAANAFVELGNVSKEQGMAMAKQLKGMMQGGVPQEKIMKEMMKNPEFKQAVKNQVKNTKEKKKLEEKKITQAPLKKEKKKEAAVNMA